MQEGLASQESPGKVMIKAVIIYSYNNNKQNKIKKIVYLISIRFL